MTNREQLITGIVAAAVTAVGALALNPTVRSVGLNIGGGLATFHSGVHRYSRSPGVCIVGAGPDIQRALREAFPALCVA
ncbi:MAG: hypothetical protein ABI670_01060 [Chloroflexota bacterium]